ncbi:hypothetical protein [Candidatus Uabimicrobium amorphum]|uniref:Uncharacterized protein n=1 Tax=Uabimicrobium amorphum TaxID=2596890 RepID=A0A5S9F122_UABAM|nr:hypothetical protein [Candidatus Uabimicrobium amorphum]BBM81751.1 hypothetical protein UABAM_00090 [Candidatus Uabimicrobium amorphum]
MDNSFATLENIEKFVQRFNDGTLREEEWTHQAHFVVALWYVLQNPFEKVLPLLREAIKKNNVALGIPNNNERGYHETITRFYLLKIAEYVTKNTLDTLCAQAFLQLLSSEIVDKKYPLLYYSRELLFSVEARKEWCQPDLRPLNELCL